MYVLNSFSTPTTVPHQWSKESEVAVDQVAPNLHLLRCLAPDSQVLRQIQHQWLQSLSKSDSQAMSISA